MHLVWPLPALLTWALAWVAFTVFRSAGLDGGPAFGLALALAAALAWHGDTRWRRVFMLAGFPLSLLASGSLGHLAPVWWLLPLAALALLYPLRSWRDAPLFPTPVGALDGLSRAAPLPAGARVVDAGCGLGDGLHALHAQYPDAVLEGHEWSWPLVLGSALRCRFARIRRTDLWAADWGTMDLVYLFQRPESMPRAMAKARSEMRPGSWLVSLEFEAVGWTPHARLETVPGKPVWVYRLPPR